MEVRLIDWDAPAAPFFGFGGVGGGYFTGPPDPKAARAICTVARDLGASDKVLLAAYEAAIVESGVHSLPYGDRDSIGLFQQRDSWGTYAQRMDPAWASRQFLVKAIRQNRVVDVRRPAGPGRAGVGLPRALRPAPGPGALADRDVLLMRRAAVILVAIALGGCGASDGAGARRRAGGPEGRLGPEQPGSGERARPVAPPRKAPRPRSRARWPPGRSASSASRAPSASAVVARRLGRRHARRPELGALGLGGAEGTGTLQVRDCDPTCASGGKDAYPATISLSGPRLCGRSTYFDRARVELDGATPTPANYVRAPC